jgi:hypothetical protein
VNLLEAEDFRLGVGETCFELLYASVRFDEVFPEEVSFVGSFHADDVFDQSIE